MSRIGLFALSVLLVPACDASPVPVDGGRIDAGSCETDEDCDDGDFCGGREICMAGSCLAIERCRSGQRCDGARRACVTECTGGGDADGDGVLAVECGGLDCDDGDPERAPGRTEVCDANDHDEDCDVTTFGFRDLDVDGVPDATCCNEAVDGTRTCGTDCDDASPSVSPTATEACNGYDDDCDTRSDEGVLGTWYEDGDGDGYGTTEASAPTETSCMRPLGFAPTNDDCDDAVGSVNPSAVERCDTDGVDEDCSGAANDVPGGCACTEPDDRVCEELLGRCAGATQSCMSGAWGPCSIEPIVETCNTVDDDCDGTVDEGQTVTCFVDGDNDGYALFGAAAVERCADPTRSAAPFLGCPLFHTARPPVTPDMDADCDDSAMAERAPTRCYRDGDGDGYGAGAITWRCPGRCGPDLVTSSNDCCDRDRDTHPGATAYGNGNVCGSYDLNCNGTVEPRYGAFGCRFIVAGCTSAGRPAFRDPVPGCGGVLASLADTCTLTSPGTCSASWNGASGGNLAVETCR